MHASLSSRVTIPEDVLQRELDDETVLLNLGSEQYYSLDDVGTRMWQLLIEHGEPAVVVAHMMTEYDVSEDSLRHDLATLICRLLDEGLLVVAQV